MKNSSVRGLELSPAQVEEFFEQGFTVVPDVFNSAEVAEMSAALDRLQDLAFRLGQTQIYNGSQFVLEEVKSGPNAGQKTIRRISWCGPAEPVLARFSIDQRLLSMAAQLLGSTEMNHLIQQVHYKLPGMAVKFDWHQDSLHRGFEEGQFKDLNGRGSYVQELVAIDDCTQENGPVLFIPGSNKLGHLSELAQPQPGVALSYDPQRAVPAIMKAGSVALFGPYTVHGSSPNQSDKPRRVFINGFAFPGASTKIYLGDGAGRLVKL